MTSEVSVGLAHAAIGEPFQVSYGRPLSWLYAGEAAAAFIAVMCKDGHDARVFDLNGICMTVEKGIEILSDLVPEHQVSTTGTPLPVPADLSDAPIREHLGAYPSISPLDGIRWTYEAFQRLQAEGRLTFG